MIKIEYMGRLGNQIFSSVGASLFAKKFDLQVINYQNVNIPEINIKLHQGNKRYDSVFEKITDENIMQYASKDKIENNILFQAYCQDPKFIKENISYFNNSFEYEKQTDYDLFVHVRLDDIVNFNGQAKFEYYDKCLRNVSFNDGFISSDSPLHPIVQLLCEKYKISLVQMSPEDTINFARKSKNLVLSNGSFSWWCGFFSNAENIFYPKQDTPWHPDFYVFDYWKSF